MLPKHTQMRRIPARPIYIIRTADPTAEGITQLAKQLARSVRKGGMLEPDGALVVVIDHDTDLDGLDEDEMRKHGWIRLRRRAS